MAAADRWHYVSSIYCVVTCVMSTIDACAQLLHYCTLIYYYCALGGTITLLLACSTFRSVVRAYAGHSIALVRRTIHAFRHRRTLLQRHDELLHFIFNNLRM